jgi:predicted DNA-binding protein (UPF0251 family)
MTVPEEKSCCRRRGRPRTARCFTATVPLRCFAPRCGAGDLPGTVTLLREELEILRLVDLEGFDQEGAALAMNVSRKTAWRDLHAARKKITEALVSGKTIEMAGCERKLRSGCPGKNKAICPKDGGGICPRPEPDSPA